MLPDREVYGDSAFVSPLVAPHSGAAEELLSNDTERPLESSDEEEEAAEVEDEPIRKYPGRPLAADSVAETAFFASLEPSTKNSLSPPQFHFPATPQLPLCMLMKMGSSHVGTMPLRLFR